MLALSLAIALILAITGLLALIKPTPEPEVATVIDHIYYGNHKAVLATRPSTGPGSDVWTLVGAGWEIPASLVTHLGSEIPLVATRPHWTW